jgi:hypothetical protein
VGEARDNSSFPVAVLVEIRLVDLLGLDEARRKPDFYIILHRRQAFWRWSPRPCRCYT